MHYTFKSTPTWTFKSRMETVTTSNQPISSPGPADYIVKKPLPQVQTVSITTEKRDLYKPFETFPAPGTYEPKSYISDGPKKSFSSRHIETIKRTPGPFQYDNNTIKVKNEAPGYTMSTKSKSYHQLTKDKNNYKPPPTAYDSFKGSFIKNTKNVMGTSERKDLTQTQKTPAPNYYSPQKAQILAQLTHPKFSMGKQSKDKTLIKCEETPGPAFYDKKGFVNQNKDHKKGYTCRSKVNNLAAMEISKVPGPGHYQPNLTNRSSAPKISYPHTDRKTFMDDMQDFKKQYPSPGAHSPKFVGTKYASIKTYHFSKSNRKDLYENQKTPGPQYKNDKIDVLNRAPRFSVGKTIPKNQFLQVNPQNPGPGQYDPSLTQVKDRSLVFNVPKEKRPDFQKHRFTPAPGSYNLRGKEQGPTWAKEKRLAFTDNKNQAKGGLMYEINGMVPNPPRYMNVSSKIKYNSPIKSYGSTGMTNKQ